MVNPVPNTNPAMTQNATLLYFGTTTEAPWKSAQMTEEEFFASLPVFDMFPLSNGDDNHVILYALLYAILFLVGVCGNVSVITLIRHVHVNVPYDNTMIYVLFLCCVDLASVVPLPMAIMDQLLGFWMFGTPLCKIYRALEHVGRCLSTFVLAAMAFDRFLRVCYPHKKTTRRFIVLQLILLSALTFVLLSPLLIKASSEEIVLKEVLLENPYRLARVRIFKCMDHLEGTMLALFITYMFTIGFFVPVLLITVFYALMMRRLFRRSRAMSNSKLPVNRIAGYTIAISVLFVLCWSPYWISMLYLNNLYNWDTNDADIQSQEETFNSEKFIYIMYGIHALPYVNSASNWLLYGLLNSQLMRRANTKQEYTGTCGNPGCGGAIQSAGAQPLGGATARWTIRGDETARSPRWANGLTRPKKQQHGKFSVPTPMPTHRATTTAINGGRKTPTTTNTTITTIERSLTLSAPSSYSPPSNGNLVIGNGSATAAGARHHSTSTLVLRLMTEDDEEDQEIEMPMPFVRRKSGCSEGHFHHALEQEDVTAKSCLSERLAETRPSDALL